MRISCAFALLLVLIPGGFSGCGRGPQRPSEAALIGTWRLGEKSFVSAAKRIGRTPTDSKIELLAGGGLRAVDMPIVDLAGVRSGATNFRYYTGAGHWDLERTQDAWELHIIIEKSDHQNFFTGAAAVPTGFYTFVEDPDSGETWAWEKTK